MKFNKIVGINLSRNLISINYVKILTLLICCIFISSTFIGCSSKTTVKKETINISSVNGGSINLTPVGEEDQYFSSAILNPNGESFLLKEESKEQLVKMYEADQRKKEKEEELKNKEYGTLTNGTLTITFNTDESIEGASGKYTITVDKDDEFTYYDKNGEVTFIEKADEFTAYDKDGNEIPDIKIIYQDNAEEPQPNIEQIQEEPEEPLIFEKFISFLEVGKNGIASNDVWNEILEDNSPLYPIYQTESEDMYFTEKSPSNEYSLHLFSKNGEELTENEVIREIVKIQERMYVQEIRWIAFKSNNDVENDVTLFNLETKETFSKPLNGYLYELFVTKNGVVVSTYDSLDDELKNVQEDLKYSKVALHDIKYTYVDLQNKLTKELHSPKMRMKIFTNPTSDTVIWANKFNINIYKQNIVADKESTLISEFFLIDEIFPTNDSAYWITPSNMFSFVYGTPNVFLVKDIDGGTLVADCFFPERINYEAYVGIFTDQEGLLTVITNNEGNAAFNTISSDNPTQFTEYTISKADGIGSYVDLCIDTIGKTRYVCTQSSFDRYSHEEWSVFSDHPNFTPAYYSSKRSETLIEKNVPILKSNIRKYTLP